MMELWHGHTNLEKCTLQSGAGSAMIVFGISKPKAWSKIWTLCPKSGGKLRSYNNQEYQKSLSKIYSKIRHIKYGGVS